MSKLAELRKKLLEKENSQRSAASDNAIFPFWNMNFDETAIIRFLPDGGPNDFFWVERQMINLTFSGIVGKENTSGKEVFLKVPCNEMFGETCPILTEVRPWFKDNSMEQIARQYWKKRSYIFQGFIRENPLREDDAPENPIRRLVINPSIYEIIKASLMDEEMEEMPTDEIGGTDFRLTKTKQGEYANYKTSNYSRKSTSLTDEELAAIETYGLKNLNDFLPKKPGADQLTAIAEMFEASVDGQMYDPARWAKFYRPIGLDWKDNSSNGNTSSKPVTETATAAPQVVAVQEEVVVAEAQPEVPEVTVSEPTVDSSTVEKKDPKDILASIKARAANKG